MCVRITEVTFSIPAQQRGEMNDNSVIFLEVPPRN